MKNNRTGYKVGILTIGDVVCKQDNKIYYKAKCFCGNEIIVSNLQINRGKQSCGCLGSVNYQAEVTDELLVSIEKETAIVLLMLKGMSKQEAKEYYSKFRKEYLENKEWI